MGWRAQLVRKVMAGLLPRRWLLVHGPSRCRQLGLTFDDGPHPEHTARLLDELRGHGIRATFFLIGERARQFPEVVRRIAAEGHAIGHHSFSHSLPGQTSAGQLLQEVRRTQDLFVDLLGHPSALVRPPYGKVTAAKLWRLWRAGLTVVLWNRDPKDFACGSAAELRNWFQRNPLRGGDLVLLHDTSPHAAAVVPDLAAAAAQAGLTFTSLDQWVPARVRPGSRSPSGLSRWGSGLQ